MILRWVVLAFVCTTVAGEHPECKDAPTAAAKHMCEQIHKWDDGARTASANKKTVSLPPGILTGGSPDLAPLVTSIEGCTDIACLCFYLTGNRANSCTYNGRPITKVMRKEYRMMTDDERQRYHAVLNTLKRSGKYNEIGRIHSEASNSGSAHSGPAFLPWHREFIKRLEFEIRKIDPTLYLPYWDSVLDGRLPRPADSIIFSDDFGGSADAQGMVVSGDFAGWTTLAGRANIQRRVGAEGNLFSDSDINFVMQQTSVDQVLAFTAPRQGCPYRTDYNCLEYTHGNIHIFVGGDMFDTATSSNDPLFFLHHSFVDLIWEQWRQQRQSRAERETDYPPDNQLCSSPQHFGQNRLQPFNTFRNVDGLSNKYTDELYSYAPRPTCAAQNPSCGSRYLFCDLSHGNPRCVAKAKVGGTCTGFTRGEDVCHNGMCQNGRCVAAANVVTTARPPPVIVTQKPPPTSVVNDCWNENQCCATWAASGECNRNRAYMTDFCKTSCGFCKPTTPIKDDCSDRHAQCSPWSKSGECAKNEAWMTENCRRSCNKCALTRAQSCAAGGTVTTARPTDVCENSDGCFNEFACCPHWANQGLCRTNQRWMSCNCRVSCSKCTPNDYYYGACEDYDKQCRGWAASGECTKNPWMEENCRQSCGTCFSQRELRSLCGATSQAGIIGSKRPRTTPNPGWGWGGNRWGAGGGGGWGQGGWGGGGWGGK